MKIGATSGFGKQGYGDTCRIWDKSRISVGEGTWFGRETIIQVLNSYSFPDGKQEFASSLTIGNDVHATEKCWISCAGNMVIEDHVLIGPEVFIIDNNHGMNPTKPLGYRNQPNTVKNIKICEGAWLGQRVCVLPGVTIGAHSIIGTGSVVTHSIPPYTIAVGSPARVVKTWDAEKKEWMSYTPD